MRTKTVRFQMFPCQPRWETHAITPLKDLFLLRMGVVKVVVLASSRIANKGSRLPPTKPPHN